jgi:hypothetical protein
MPMHAKVSSGNVHVLLAAQDEKDAMDKFNWLMKIGPPFGNSRLSDLMAIKNMETERVHYAPVNLD